MPIRMVQMDEPQRDRHEAADVGVVGEETVGELADGVGKQEGGADDPIFQGHHAGVQHGLLDHVEAHAHDIEHG